MHTELQRDLILAGLDVTRNYLKLGDIGTASRNSGMTSGEGRAFLAFTISAACLPKYCRDFPLPSYPDDCFIKDPLTGHRGMILSKVMSADILDAAAFWLFHIDRMEIALRQEEVVPYKVLPANYVDLELSWLELDVRSTNALISANVYTVGDLLNLPVSDFTRIPNFGKQSQMTVTFLLKHYGLQIGKIPRSAAPANIKPHSDNMDVVSLHIHTLGTNSVLGTIVKCMLETTIRPAAFNISYDHCLVGNLEAEVATATYYLNDYRPTITLNKTVANPSN